MKTARENTQDTQDPLIEFQDTGRAAVIDYDLPTSSTYQGLRLVDLELKGGWFQNEWKRKPPPPWDELPKREIPELGTSARAEAERLRTSPDIDDQLQAEQWIGVHEAALAEKLAVDQGMKDAAGALEGLWRRVWHDIFREPTPNLDEFRDFKDQVHDAARAHLAATIYLTGLWPGYGGETALVQDAQVPTEHQQVDTGEGTVPITTYSASVPGGSETANPAIYGFTAEDLIELAENGYRVVPAMLQSGRVVGRIVEEPLDVDLRVLLVEYYQLSSFLGDYGAGRTLSTATLLPGEESSITIRTWKQRTETVKESSSVLDSYDDAVAEEFGESIQNESSQRDKVYESLKWKVETSANASWGWGSANVEAGVAGENNSSREDFARNTSNALTKHAAKVSHTRKVEINSSSELREEEGEETLLMRTVKNINLSRVMNFVFRELNQEFISYLSLIDVRVAFVNGCPNFTDVVPLSGLDGFLKKYIVSSRRNTVYAQIIDACRNVLDFRDQRRELIEEVPDLSDAKGGYWRVKQGPLSEDDSEEMGGHPHLAAKTPGIIIRKTRSILPTDAVIVDALLGEGVALDSYALNSQMETLRSKANANELSEVEIEKLRLALEIIREKDAEKAELYFKIFGEKLKETEVDS